MLLVISIFIVFHHLPCSKYKQSESHLTTVSLQRSTGTIRGHSEGPEHGLAQQMGFYLNPEAHLEK